MFEIIAVDISGRHSEDNEYFMVCAAVYLSISSDHIYRTHEIKLRNFIINYAPNLNNIIKIVKTTVSGLNPKATIIIESGDMFNKEIWLINSMLSYKIKYPESIAEHKAIELAHHISLSARRLLKYNKSENI